jgi:hypothetical protein
VVIVASLHDRRLIFPSLPNIVTDVKLRVNHFVKWMGQKEDLRGGGNPEALVRVGDILKIPLPLPSVNLHGTAVAWPAIDV